MKAKGIPGGSARDRLDRYWRGDEVLENKYEVHAAQKFPDIDGLPGDAMTVELVTTHDGRGPAFLFESEATYIDLQQAMALRQWLDEKIMEAIVIRIGREEIPTWSDMLNYKTAQ